MRSGNEEVTKGETKGERFEGERHGKMKEKESGQGWGDKTKR